MWMVFFVVENYMHLVQWQKLLGIRDEKNTLDVGILDIAADVYQNEKEIASIYAHKRIY